MRCRHCDYDVTGLPQDSDGRVQCSECGMFGVPVLQWRWRWWTVVRVVAISEAPFGAFVALTAGYGLCSDWNLLPWGLLLFLADGLVGLIASTVATARVARRTEAHAILPGVFVTTFLVNSVMLWVLIKLPPWWAC